MRLGRDDARAVAGLIGELGRVELEHPACFPRVTATVRSLLRSEVGLSYSVRNEGADVRPDSVHFSGGNIPVAQAERIFSKWITVEGADFGAYNPMRPPPSQRNRALRMADLVGRGGFSEDHPFFTRLMPAMRLMGYDQARVLVCDGASVLGWVGALRREVFTVRELAILRRITPHLRRRLRLERELQAPTGRALLHAVLDALGAPAFLTGATGRIFHANELGRSIWDRDPAASVDSLGHAIRGEPGPFEATRLHSEGLPAMFLVIARAGDPSRAPKVARAAHRWGLTSRQAQVLDLLARGLTNRRIAAELACSERTIEAHVAAIFEKAQIGSRAALVARVLA